MLILQIALVLTLMADRYCFRHAPKRPMTRLPRLLSLCFFFLFEGVAGDDDDDVAAAAAADVAADCVAAG